MKEPLRPSTMLFRTFAVLIALFALIFVHAATQKRANQKRLSEVSRLAAGLGLTDLALFSEAPYTRHPSQADRHAPFQNHPLALDPFPSGSFAAVPEQLLRKNVDEGLPQNKENEIKSPEPPGREGREGFNAF